MMKLAVLIALSFVLLQAVEGCKPGKFITHSFPETLSHPLWLCMMYYVDLHISVFFSQL